jgi:hypothetical protein
MLRADRYLIEITALYSRTEEHSSIYLLPADVVFGVNMYWINAKCLIKIFDSGAVFSLNTQDHLHLGIFCIVVSFSETLFSSFYYLHVRLLALGLVCLLQPSVYPLAYLRGAF